jgi:hypothetical protein
MLLVPICCRSKRANVHKRDKRGSADQRKSFDKRIKFNKHGASDNGIKKQTTFHKKATKNVTGGKQSQ